MLPPPSLTFAPTTCRPSLRAFLFFFVRLDPLAGPEFPPTVDGSAPTDASPCRGDPSSAASARTPGRVETRAGDTSLASPTPPGLALSFRLRRFRSRRAWPGSPLPTPSSRAFLPESSASAASAARARLRFFRFAGFPVGFCSPGSVMSSPRHAVTHVNLGSPCTTKRRRNSRPDQAPRGRSSNDTRHAHVGRLPAHTQCDSHAPPPGPWKTRIRNKDASQYSILS